MEIRDRNFDSWVGQSKYKNARPKTPYYLFWLLMCSVSKMGLNNFFHTGTKCFDILFITKPEFILSITLQCTCYAQVAHTHTHTCHAQAQTYDNYGNNTCWTFALVWQWVWYL